MKSSILMVSVVALAVVLSGTGPVDSKTRKQSNLSSSQHPRRDTQQDLPMPHPSSRRISGHTHHHHPGAHAGRPQDISGGNGQKLTRQRKF